MPFHTLHGTGNRAENSALRRLLERSCMVIVYQGILGLLIGFLVGSAVSNARRCSIEPGKWFIQEGGNICSALNFLNSTK
jgi:hypothetical protein